MLVRNESCVCLRTLWCERVNVWGKQGRHSFVHTLTRRKRVWNVKCRNEGERWKADLMFNRNLNAERELFESLKVIELRVAQFCCDFFRNVFFFSVHCLFATFSELPACLGSDFSLFFFTNRSILWLGFEWDFEQVKEMNAKYSICLRFMIVDWEMIAKGKWQIERVKTTHR